MIAIIIIIIFLAQLHLQYERVPQHRQPAMQHLADPVEEYIPLIRTSQTFTITDLPKGKYIVCGEAMDKMGKVYQEGCLETRISQKEKKGMSYIISIHDDDDDRSADRSAGVDTGINADDGVSDPVCCDVPGLC